MRKQYHKAAPLTLAELHNAEHYRLRKVEEDKFSEVQALPEEKKLPSTSQVLRLLAFLDEGRLLHVGGHLQELEASLYVNQPVLLPAKNAFAHPVPSAAHKRVFNGRVEAALPV